MYRMPHQSLDSFFKLLLAAGAAVFLPLGQEMQKDHLSGAYRTQYRWGGVPLTGWKAQETIHSRWVRDVLGLPPDYFTAITGPSVFGTCIGALPRNGHEVAIFRQLWTSASAEDQTAIRIQAVLCLMEPDADTREQMVQETQRRSQGS